MDEVREGLGIWIEMRKDDEGGAKVSHNPIVHLHGVVLAWWGKAGIVLL